MQSILNNYITHIKKCRHLLLLLFSFHIISASGQNLNNPNKRGPLGTQVNTLSGNLFIQRTDIYIPARGFGLDISFHYNSFLFTEDYGYGKGWTFEYNIKYNHDTIPGARLLLWGDGREDKYDSLPDGSYQTPRGFFNTLSQYQPGKYVLTELNGVQYFFDNPVYKRITRKVEPNGNFINFTYTDSLLTSIVNAAGQSISFTYNPEGRLATVVDAVAAPARTFTYIYDATGNLKEVNDPQNDKYQYTYLVNGPMKSIADRNNNKVDIIYFPDISARELIGCNKRLSFSYDTSSNVTVVTDHLESGNQVTKYTYQKMGGESWVTSMSGNCCGFNVSYEYDDKGNNTKRTDANGQIYTYTYDGSGNVLTSTNPNGDVNTYTYTADFKKISSYKDPKGNVYSLSYDAKGNLTQLLTPGNNLYTATYNSSGDIITGTDPKGNTYSYNYDAWGNPVTVTGPNGYYATLSFDPRGNLLSFTDARGNSSSGEYDILDRLKKITDPVNDKVQYAYDAEGNIVSYKNKNNETSVFDYDASNRLVKVTGPTGNQTSFVYDGMDNVLSVRNALGNELKLAYDKLNRLKMRTDAEGNKILYEYDGNGNITSVIYPNGKTAHYVYDQLNRLVSSSDEEGTLASLVYDKNGNKISYTNATGAVTSATYDELNRVKQITDPLGNSVVFAYDKNNNIISFTDREGHTSFYTYDSLDRVKTYTDNNGYVVAAGYDAQGHVISLTDQNSNITVYAYDALGRRKRMTYPDGKYSEFNYDNKGNITSVRLTDASVIIYQYDTLNRMLSRTLPDGEVYGFTYDKLNRVLTGTNSKGTVSFTYDKMNRVTSETFAGRTTKYSYNISGRTHTVIYPDSTIVVKEYDTRSRLIKVLKDSIVLAQYSYNNANQLTQKTFANGVSSLMQYDYANRLSNINTSNGSIQNTIFSYDKENNKTAITRSNNTSLSEQFTYDNSYRLLNYRRGPIGSPVLQNGYIYDAVGNRTAANLNGVATTYTINNLNQLTGANGTSFSFDDRGNIIYDGSFYKTYDAENRLIKDSSSPASVITYGYDALGRRISKSINGNTLKYTYSGAAQIEERDGSNNLLNKTVFAGFLSPVMNQKNGNQFYYHSNEIGSVEAISNSNGRLMESYRYDAFGKPSRYDSLSNPLTSSIAGNRFGFTGQEYDSASGSYRFFYRNYSPETGVFNQRDLIEYGDGMGMYQYVGNNPANGVDVLGLDKVYDTYGLPIDWEFAPGQTYETEKLFAGDPCYHDNSKVKYITNQEVQRTKETMIEHLDKFGDGILADFEGIGSADSRYYTKLAKSQFASGENMYYFKGQQMHNYEVNYYFTGYASGVKGYESSTATDMSMAWNVAKGFKEWLWDDKGTGRLSSSLDPNEIRTKNMREGNMDGEFGTAMMRNPEFNSQALDNKVIPNYGEWWPVINPETGEMGYEFFAYRKIKSEHLKGFRQYIKENCQEDGGTKKERPKTVGEEKEMKVTTPIDPNEIIGPAGVPYKKWVSVKDRLPYTILFENDSSATARARYIKITTPIEPKQDPTTLELGSVGFNNQSFEIPQGRSFYYQRLDARDSTGVYVDLTAGYDVVNNQIFWEFQAIDPITLLPPDDPEAGFLFLHDSLQSNYGNGFVNFSIKPRADAQTLDTIGARAFIVFDENEVISTNIHTNTIDAVAPTSNLNTISGTGTNPIILSWAGGDDTNGCGIDYYTIYVSDDLINYSMLIPRISRTDTTLSLPYGSNYCFFVLATDRVGNTETLRPGVIKCSSVGNPLPVTLLYFNGTNQAKNNLLKWATTSEQNSKEFRLERSLNGSDFNQIAVVAAAGNSVVNRDYQYTDRNIDRLNSNVMFYRLKQVDLDNNFKYSGIVRLNYRKNGASPSIIYPNPTNGSSTVLIGDNSLIGTEATVTDVNGRILQRVKITSGSHVFDLSSYMNGLYLIRLSNKETLKVMKQ